MLQTQSGRTTLVHYISVFLPTALNICEPYRLSDRTHPITSTDDIIPAFSLNRYRLDNPFPQLFAARGFFHAIAERYTQKVKNRAVRHGVLLSIFTNNRVKNEKLRFSTICETNKCLFDQHTKQKNTSFRLRRCACTSTPNLLSSNVKNSRVDTWR